MKKKSVCPPGAYNSEKKTRHANKYFYNTVARISYVERQPGVSQPGNVKSIWSTMELKVNVSSLIFCLDDLSTDKNGLLKFPTIIVLLFISPFRSVNICCIYLGALKFAA